MMPPGQVLAGRDEPVGAGRGQPGDGPDIFRIQPDAVGHLGETVFIILAAAGAGIEQCAANGREINPPGVFVLELGETALAAAVAQ